MSGNASGLSRFMVLVPMAGNIDPTAHPNAIVALHMV
jgi:hypothetical protein